MKLNFKEKGISFKNVLSRVEYGHIAFRVLIYPGRALEIFEKLLSASSKSFRKR